MITRPKSVSVQASAIELGKWGENVIAQRLLELGLPVELTHHYAPYDIGVDKLRIEVKTTTALRTIGAGDHVAFPLAPQRKNFDSVMVEKDYGAACDFVVCLWAGNETYPLRLWVLPAHLLPRGLTIRIDEKARPSKWQLFEGRLDLIADSPLRQSGSRNVGECVAREEKRGSPRSKNPSRLRDPLEGSDASSLMAQGARHTHAIQRERTASKIREALETLAGQGIERPSSRQIAQTAGLSRSTVMRWKQSA